MSHGVSNQLHMRGAIERMKFYPSYEVNEKSGLGILNKIVYYLPRKESLLGSQQSEVSIINIYVEDYAVRPI